MSYAATAAMDRLENSVSGIMTKKKITPDVVKKIEVALEERKPKAERRQKADVPVPTAADRRKVKDRRTED
jgi:hypothetical protein